MQEKLEKSSSYKQCWPYMVSIQKIFFEKNYEYKKNSIPTHFVSLSKVCFWEENISKQRMQPSKSLPSNGFVVNTL